MNNSSIIQYPLVPVGSGRLSMGLGKEVTVKAAPMLDGLMDGTNVAVVTLLGSLCPVTLGHVQAFEAARELLLGCVHGASVRRPARLEYFTQVLGFISLNGDSHVKRKLLLNGEVAMDFATRQTLVDLAIADYAWIDGEAYQGASLWTLRRRWPRLVFTHFFLNGADDVVKCKKYKWARANARFITIGRPGSTDEVLAGMKAHGVDPDAGLFILGPELPDISSTAARKALAAWDIETLRGLLHPRVIELCLLGLGARDVVPQPAVVAAITIDDESESIDKWKETNTIVSSMPNGLIIETKTVTLKEFGADIFIRSRSRSLPPLKRKRKPPPQPPPSTEAATPRCLLRKSIGALLIINY